MNFDLVIRGAEAVLSQASGEYKTERVDIGMRGGRIEKIGAIPPTHKDFDATGLTALPGVIDSQVHFREPGPTHKEDLATGSRAAVLGGVTCFCEMPNTKPPTATAEALQEKIERALGRSWCDFGFFIGATPENISKLQELERLPGCSGIKVFMGSSTGDLLLESDELVREVLKNTTRRVTFHAEDEFRLRERKHLTETGGVQQHPVWRDAETAFLATSRVLRIAREFKRLVHILHVTSRDEMEILARNKDLATVEVTPQHLTLSAPECYDRLGTLAQMNPPIRDLTHQNALWRALQNGIVDVVATDHAPHTLEEKAQSYPASPSGMPGVQTMVPIMLTHVNSGKLTLHRLVDLICRNPARVVGLPTKGRIAHGFDADLTLVDLKREETIQNASQASKCGWTPFDGFKVTGWPVATIVRGNVVMRDGEVLGQPSGQPAAFQF